jgi:WD40 repeat protein
VLGLAYAPDGATLATAGADHTVRFWDTRTHQAKAVLTGHTDLVTSVAYSCTGRIVSGSWDATVRVWDGPTGSTSVRDVEKRPVLSVACSPDGKTIAVGTLGAGARLRDAASGRETIALAPADRSVHALAFTPDGKLVAGGCGDGAVYLWNAASGRLRGIWPGHQGAVRVLAFVLGGRVLAAGGNGRVLRFWDVAHGRQT